MSGVVWSRYIWIYHSSHFFAPVMLGPNPSTVENKLYNFCVLHLPFCHFSSKLLWKHLRDAGGRGREGRVRKGWNMLPVRGCICYLRVLGAPGSVKEWGLIPHLKTGVWECSFPLAWRFFFSPTTATTFSVWLTEFSDEPGHEAGNKELVFYSAMSVLPPVVPLAPEQASAFLLLCHPTPVQSRSRRHCGMQTASCVIRMLP